MKQLSGLSLLALGVLGWVLLAVPFSRGLAGQESPSAGQQGDEIVLGQSTWRDVERLLGRAYIVDHPADRGRRREVWYMVYPMHPAYHREMTFVINLQSGVVEERYYGERELEVVRRLVTEFHAPYCWPEDPWGPWVYKGIVAGQSRRTDVERLLGQPERVYECGPPEQDMAVLEYPLPDLEGKLQVAVSCEGGVAERIHLRPRRPWPLEKALTFYGDGYCYRRFFIVDDSRSGEVSECGAGKEDPRGNVVSVEYRSLGVVLDLDSSGRVWVIAYEKHPD